MTSRLDDIAAYYSEKLVQHGPSPRGVDWNGEQGQVVRFDQLARIIDGDGEFTINDLGCGYGAFVEFLHRRFERFDYAGFDVSQAMVDAARARFEADRRAAFSVSDKPDRIADYTVASGIFNVRLEWPDADWKSYILSTLDLMNESSEKGFAFNCLTSYSDAHRMRPNLFYADPCELFDHCKNRFSHNVALLHDYDLYEFTILVKHVGGRR